MMVQQLGGFAGFGRIARLTCVVSMAALLLRGAPAAAQATAQPQTEQNGAYSEKITVTGSLLRQTGMETPVPVTVVSADELQSMSPSSLAEAVTQLPEFYNSQTPNSTDSWFTRGGYGNLNIRGLGINRTLTLLNGRRVISQTAFGGVDVTMFPQETIKSVETVTGGASAAYGTDAVAGVANFILDTGFKGLRLSAQGGETTRGDSGTYNFSGAFGTSFLERGHLLVSGQIFKQDGVHNYKGRDWYQGWGTVPDSTGMLHIVPHVVSRDSTFGGLIFAPGTPLNGLQFNPDGSTSPYITSSVSSGTLGTPPARQSIANGGSGDDLGAAIQTIYPDVKHNSEFAYADYELTNDLTVFGQWLRGEEHTFRYNTPSGSLQGTPTAITIFSGNAFLPASVQQVMTANHIASFTLRRTGNPTDFGAQMTLSDESVMNSITGGFDWDINSDGFLHGWKVRGYYQYGHSTRNGYQVGLRVDRIFAAVDAVKDPTGKIVCQTTLFNSQFAGCQPLNLFGVGNASPAAVDWVVGNDVGLHITTPLFFADGGFGPGQTYSYTSQEAKVITTNMNQQVAELSMDGEVFQGWGAGAITAAFGGSYRRESIRQIVQDTTNPPDDNTKGHPVLCNSDPAAIAAGLRGVNAPDCANTVGIQYSKVSNILGAIDVKEAFAETAVPIIADAPFMQSLRIDLAGRWADYSGSGTIWAYKGGVDADIIDGLRLRSTYSRDVRAANLSERFDKTGGSAVVTDPRYPGDGSITVTIFSGGNPSVRPEEADTFTAGAVVQPAFLEGLSLSVDWYRIKIKDAIGQLGAQAVVNQCEAGATALCSLITRNPTTDRLVLVGNVYVNINETVVRGIDLETSFNRDINLFGNLSGEGGEAVAARFFASWLLENTNALAGAAPLDRAGQTGIQQSDGVAYALPNFKATGNLSYSNGGLSVFLQGRYIGSGTIENALKVGKDIERNTVSSAFYVDARVGYRFDTLDSGNVELLVSATNLFDQDPPITPYYSAFNSYAQQYNPSLFDVLGRRFVAGVRFAY
jgi:outer membrane receptor protein involved in Fe transport